jgi:hypothetical protein
MMTAATVRSAAAGTLRLRGCWLTVSGNWRRFEMAVVMVVMMVKVVVMMLAMMMAMIQL